MMFSRAIEKGLDCKECPSEENDVIIYGGEDDCEIYCIDCGAEIFIGDANDAVRLIQIKHKIKRAIKVAIRNYFTELENNLPKKQPMGFLPPHRHESHHV